ncbi:hypothetical protein MD484_g1371, partial [Candolleomyces efflorescens]
MLPAGKKQSDARKVGIDAGDIWAHNSMDQPSGATFSQMRDQLGVEGGKLLVELLRDFKNQKQIYPQPQIVVQLHRRRKKPPGAGGLSDIRYDSRNAVKVSTEAPTRAVQLHDLQVYGRQPNAAVEQRLPSYPGAVICSACDNGMPSEKALFIRCLDGSILSVRKIKPEGKPVLDAQAFWNGVRKYKDVQFIGHGAA